MPKLVLVIFLCYGCLVNAYAQNPYFEYSKLDAISQRGIFAIEDSHGNFLISIIKEDGTAEILKLNEEGQYVDVVVLQENNAILTVSNIYESEDFFYCPGFIDYDDTDSSYFYIAKLNSDLELLSEKKILLDESQTFIMNCSYSESDSLICVGYSDTPDVSISPFGLYYTYPDDTISFFRTEGVLDIVNDYLTLPGIQNEIVLRGQINMTVTDDNFSVTESVPVPFNLSQTGDVYAFNDTSFLISGKVIEVNLPPLPTVRDIGIGFSSYDFEESNFYSFGMAGDTVDHPGIFHSIGVTESNYIYCGGTGNISPSPPLLHQMPSWFLLTRLNADLAPVWEKRYGGDAYYVMFGLDATSDEGCIMYGLKHDYLTNPGIAELYVLKTDASGNVVSDITIPYPNLQVEIFPNPFTEVIQITASDYENHIVNVELRDIAGKLHKIERGTIPMTVSVDKSVKPGQYILTIYAIGENVPISTTIVIKKE